MIKERSRYCRERKRERERERERECPDKEKREPIA